LRTVFVDTVYWIAIARPDDQWHQAAAEARLRLGSVQMVTTDEVLTEFLAALKRAFPPLRLEWLILGDGEPTTIAERLAAPEGLETKAGSATGEDPSFAARVLARHPDLELLSPEASALFMAALTRLAMGEPKLALDEKDLMQLAGDLRWLLLLPPGAWGFHHTPPYRTFSDYAVAMLHAGASASTPKKPRTRSTGASETPTRGPPPTSQ